MPDINIQETPKKISEGKISEEFIRNKINPLIVETLNSSMKFYSVVGASVSTLAAIPVSVAQKISGGILVGALSGPGWNLLDSVGGTLSALHTLKKSRTSAIHKNTQTLFGGANLFWFSSALPALTLWGYASELKSIIHHTHNIKSFFTAGATVAAAPAMAASSFAFAMAMFVMAGNAAYKWYRAEQKADPVDLLKDRLEKYEVLNEKINNTTDEAERQSLANKRARIEAQTKALYHYCTVSENLNENQKKKFDEIKHSVNERQELAKKYNTDIVLANYLILKQQRKIEASKFDFVANLMGGIGATFAGLAVLSIFFCPPAGMLLAFAAAAFFGVSAGMKTRQLLDKRAQAKNVEKAFVNAQSLNKGLTKEQFEENMIVNFFNRLEFQGKEFQEKGRNGKLEIQYSEIEKIEKIEKQLSDADKKEIIAMEAKFSLSITTENEKAAQNPAPT